MKKEYKEIISRFFPLEDGDLEAILKNVFIIELPIGTMLLSEGDIASKLFMVLDGCLRAFFVKESGSEITSQFFIEGQAVSSFESAMTGTPSRANIDAIEDSIVAVIQIKDLENMTSEFPSVKNQFAGYLMGRLMYYMNLHASFILDNPEKRYVKLVKDNPELVSRLPQQFIASYLGITPVSLSRIRKRIKKQINNG